MTVLDYGSFKTRQNSRNVFKNNHYEFDIDLGAH